MKRTKTVKRVIGIAAATLALLVIVSTIVVLCVSMEQNKTIQVTSYTVSHDDIPAAFDGKRIVQLSDLHNKDYGDQLTELVRQQQPDIIVITGDWISYDDTDITVAENQAKALCGIAPIYYVTGNHESCSPLYGQLCRVMESLGIKLLDNQTVDWDIDGDSIQLIGVSDPEFGVSLYQALKPLVEEERYSVVLYHRPEYFEHAVYRHADLVLSGHTHGGQVRLPLIGAVYAPQQGFFPTYDVGMFTQEDTTMIVSQGLGESEFMRVLAPPEVVIVTLDSPYR